MTRRRARRAFSLRAAVLVVFGLAVLFLLAVFLLDHGHLEDEIEAMVSELLGREFAIDGELQLSIGPVIVVTATDVRLASTEWGAEPELVRLDRVHARVELLSLFGETVDVQALELQGLAVMLEENAAGADNYTFEVDDAAAADEASQDTALPVVIRDLHGTDLRIDYRAPALTAPMRALVNDIRVVATADAGATVALAGSVNGVAANATVSIADLNGLVNGVNLEVGLDAAVGEVSVEGDAAIADLADPGRPEADLLITGPSSEYLLDLLNLPGVTTGPLDMRFAVAPQGSNMQAKIAGRFGDFEVDIKAEIDDLDQPAYLSLQGGASGPDLSVFGAVAGIDDLPADAFELAADARIEDRSVDVELLRLDVGDASFSVAARADDYDDLGTAELKADAAVPDIRQFDALLGLEGELEGPASFRAVVIPQSDVAAHLDLQLELAGWDMEAVATLERVPGKTIIRNGSARAAGLALDLDGSVGDDPLGAGTALDIGVVVERPREFAGHLGLEIPDELPGSPLAVDARALSSNGVVSLESLVAEFASARLEMTGSVAGFDRGDPAINAQVALLVEDLAEFAPDGTAIPIAALDVAAAVQLLDGRLALDEIELQAGESRLRGRLSVTLPPQDFGLEADLTGGSPDLMTVFPEIRDIAGEEPLPLAFSLRGSLYGGTWDIAAFEAQVDRSEIEVQGKLTAPPTFAGSRARAAVAIPDARRFAAPLGLQLPPEPVNLTLQMESTGRGLVVDDFAAAFGGSDLSGRAEYVAGELPAFSLDLRASRIDLDSYLPEPAEPGERDDAAPGDRVIPDIELPLPLLRQANVDVALAVEELLVNQRRLFDVGATVSVQDGRLRADDIRLTDSEGRLRGSLGIAPQPGGAEVWIRLAGENIDLGLPADSPEDVAALPRYDLTLAAIGWGDNVREIAASLNGYVKLIGGPGKVRMQLVNTLSQDFVSELLSAVNPFLESDPYSEFQCTTVLLAVEDGQLEGDPALVTQSERLRVTADLEVNLETESIAADINSVPQKGLGISLVELINPYIEVGGTMAEPQLRFDSASALLEGGAAVATGGISILGKNLAQRFLATGDPCAKALENAEERFAELEARYGGQAPAE